LVCRNDTRKPPSVQYGPDRSRSGVEEPMGSSLKPMLAKTAEDIPSGPGWTYEPKWDGFRTIVDLRGEEPRLASRDDRPLGRYFPEIVALLAERAGGIRFLADGELLMVRPGRMDFDELQLRLHPAESRVRRLAREIPTTLLLFDLLEDADGSLVSLTLAERRERLAALARDLGASVAPDALEAIPQGPALLVAPWTDDVSVAKRWFTDDVGIGQDGIVAKRADQPYLPGARGWVKVKHRRTADCVVGGYRVAKNDDGVGSLLLGLYDDTGILHYVGHTSSFRAAERRAIRTELGPLEGGVSFGQGRSPGGRSRWSGGRETEWVPLTPAVVCEVRFDRLQSGRFRHAATFVRWRPDRDPRSCTFEQLATDR
jgi:ATP-dependent DNA ligase